MVATPVTVPHLDDLKAPFTLLVSAASWRTLHGLAELALASAPRPSTLYLRLRYGRCEILVADEDWLVLMYPDAQVEDVSVADFSIEVDPAVFTRVPSGDGVLSVVPNGRGGYAISIVEAGVEVGRVESSGWQQVRDFSFADPIGDRVVTVLSEPLRNAVHAVHGNKMWPGSAQITVQHSDLTIASRSGTLARVALPENQHAAKFELPLRALQAVIDCVDQAAVELVLPLEGWSPLCVRTLDSLAAVRTLDPFTGSRHMLDLLLESAVTSLPRDGRGRHFVGVRGTGRRLYFDLVDSSGPADPPSAQIRLTIEAGTRPTELVLETRLDLASATPESLKAAIDEISSQARSHVRLSRPTEIIDPEFSQYREHLTANQCNRLLRHAHSIPICHGYTAEYVADHFPGWTWNDLVEVFRAAGILIREGGESAHVDERVVRFHFSGPTAFHVEWREAESVDV